MDLHDIETVRAFNRIVTLRAGAADSSYLGRGRPLGQARLLFEIGPQGADVQSLRAKLGLDSGYASRLLRDLERQGLVDLRPDPDDGRRRLAALTAAGLAEWQAYDDLSDQLASTMLDPLSGRQRERLLAAMREVCALLSRPAVEIAMEAPDSADARACVAAYIAELAETFEEGFDPANGNPTPEIAAMTPPAGCFLVARLDGRAVGCGALHTLEPGIGEIKRMWVAREARGLGVAGRLLEALETKARAFGMRRVRLDTNRALTAAQAMYRKAGYAEIPRFNANPYANFWFEKDLAAAD
ncbi:MAG: bifunctional helix-turn-helix transcriptional regulator/GNAT family N-acetyltransferase [Rhizobiaceae bacterium]|nr:bifunctional helix-turn-helix transcriptional regulator/GNAT family N-acetyltransferase [Rhizobiaceae bacterium]